MKFHRPSDDPASVITCPVALGFREADLPNWDQVRDAQHAEAARRIPTAYMLTLIGVVMTVAILWRPAGNTALLGWAACDTLAMLVLMWMTRSLPRARRLLGGRTHFYSLIRGSLLGMFWIVPGALAVMGSEAQRLAMCLVTAGMMAFIAITALTLPLGMMSALLFASVGPSIMFASAGGDAAMMILPQLYALALAIGGAFSTRDFLRRRWSELEATESREVVSLLLREFEEDDADWLWQTDAAKALVQVSPRMADAAGRPMGELEGRSLPRMIAGEQWSGGPMPPELTRLIELLNARESFSDLQLPVRVGGDTRWWSLSAAPRFSPEGDYLGFRGRGTDVTAQRRSVEKIDRMAKFDALTGLANREHFMDQLRKALARLGRAEGDDCCALLLVDLDRFKPVNDTMGHPIGDRLLRLVAERLRNLTGESDLAGRLGGDEFALLLRHAAPDRVEQLGEAIIARLSEPFEIDGHLIRIGASVGSAIGPRDGRVMEPLVRHADLALYRAKDDGRGCHRRYDASLLAATNRRRAIEEGLRRALDNGTLHLLYQPIADARTGQVHAYEALVRWTDPVLGEIPPAMFIPVAEEARLSSRIGAWVLRTACADAARWDEDLIVNVNLSTEQLGDRQLAATVLSALSHAGLPAARLTVELSENVFLSGAGVAGVIQTLRGLGVRVALDDFGTGHAALTHLAGGGVDVVKIDETLVAGVAQRRADAIALVRAVIALAGSLGIETIAEGTETDEQHDGMAALGCRYVQGHLIGSPVDDGTVRAMAATAMRIAS